MSGYEEDEPTSDADHAFQEALNTHYPTLTIEDLDGKQLDHVLLERDKILAQWGKR